MLAIIMAIKDDDDRLFVEMIFNKYSKNMYLIAERILNNHDDAEDCVQDTFVNFIDKLVCFKIALKEDILIKLIMITCRNTAFDKYAKNKRRANLQFSQTVYDEDGESSIADIPDRSADVERIVMNSYVCAYVKELINKLDCKYRDVITLKSMGYNYEQISCIIGISQALARKRYSRARAMILDMGGETLYEYRDE